MFYLLICKLFICLRQRRPQYASQNDTDPFFQLLLNCQNDTLAHENMIMLTSTLKMTTNIVTWIAIKNTYKDEEQILIQFPIDILSLLMLWWIYLKGTRYDILFSNSKITLIIIFAVVDIGLSLL